MYIFLYHTDKPAGMPEKTFLTVDIQTLYLKKDDSYLYRMDQEEHFANAISEFLDQTSYKGVKAVVINKELGGSGWGRALRLAGHIATRVYRDCALNTLPIVLTTGRPLDIRDTSLSDTAIHHPFQAGGFYFRTHAELFCVEPDPISGEPGVLGALMGLEPVDLRKLKITGSEDNRHQATNEWGAMRLARNFGLMHKVDLDYPRHLYFKYLATTLRDEPAAPDRSLNGLFRKVLLIDDLAYQGWQSLLTQVFNCPVDVVVPRKEDASWKSTDFAQYDLILLDLYLANKPDKTMALKVLEHVKRGCPHLPVIIFTASEKALNLAEVVDQGADGMYIKESPAHLLENGYSQENYRHFCRTITAAHEKYKVLRPYWEGIEKIVVNGNFMAIPNSPKVMRERLAERLKMFYGLLKKGYEQSRYDKNTFFYSDYELAFITLWSILNEIQESKFQKISNDLEVQWKLSSGNAFYINFQFAVSGRRGTPARFRTALRTADLNWFRRSSPKKMKRDFEQQIRLQIRFLIERMRPEAETTMLDNLDYLNQTRNKLYLTHGDNAAPEFYACTEREKRRTLLSMTPGGDIKILFELVAFLLTGDEGLRL